ncbi:exosortase/archaeosortase family protein [Tautonia marina]|uniref:exosortase/archaeosortase family protein n=1 Tax=Tautonia marina TaxID=2653855 RepID=UPI001376280E|nr:exosortase/archaeosortase family protein [Tautonia marina]
MELVVLLACLGWVCWPVLGDMIHRWSTDPRYGHGYLVPLFALGLLWMRRPSYDLDRARGSLWGVVLVASGSAVYLLGGYVGSGWIEGLSLLPVLTGLCVLFGGTTALRWAAPSLAFLFFMIPLPWRFEVALGASLQRIATKLSTVSLQTLGFVAYSEGNVIVMEEGRIGVVEACSGLGMLMTFIAISTAVAIVVQRPWFDRILIVLSAIPIALIANIARITLTGVLHETVGGEWADRFYHDLAGWLMIPFALGLLMIELWVLSRLFVELEAEEPVPGLAMMGFAGNAGHRGVSNLRAGEHAAPPLPGPTRSTD